MKVSYNIQIFNNDGDKFIYFGATNYLKQSINPNLHEEDIIHLM